MFGPVEIKESTDVKRWFRAVKSKAACQEEAKTGFISRTEAKIVLYIKIYWRLTAACAKDLSSRWQPVPALARRKA